MRKKATFFLKLFLPSILVIFLSSQLVYAERIHLKNGETIKGKIQSIDASSMLVESELGYGSIQIPRSEINSIEFPAYKRDMARLYGIGYRQYRSTVNDSQNYNTDQISLKTFFDNEIFFEFLAGYGSTRITSESGESTTQVLAVDARIGKIIKSTPNTLIYFGGSAGVIDIEDEDDNLSTQGTRATIFLGSEFFFTALPNFGFSGEIGASYIDADGYKTQDLFTSSFPSFSIHYYF